MSTTLTVRVGVDEADSELAAALGWEGGVPGADVNLLRNGTGPEAWRTTTTDASGRATFENVLDGRYRLYAGRTLTDDEAQAIGEPVRAFGDGRTFDVSGAAGDVTLQLYADRPGSFVISELMDVAPPPTEASDVYGMYFEVYNNGDRTLYLDGRVFGAAYQYGVQEFDHTSCAQSEPARNDPNGIYARHLIAFPGSGSEYPIAPEGAKVVAISATDHSQVHPMLLDLSDADFEVGTAAMADNPAVPNMLDVGLESFVLEPYGSPLTAIGDVFFLADPLNPQSMPIEFRDPQGRGYVRVPAGSIFDAISFFGLAPDGDQEHPPCIPLIHETFDRYEDASRGVELHDYSFVRRVLRTAGGRTILQNTNTTAVDFIHGEYSPGSVP